MRLTGRSRGAGDSVTTWISSSAPLTLMASYVGTVFVLPVSVFLKYLWRRRNRWSSFLSFHLYDRESPTSLSSSCPYMQIVPFHSGNLSSVSFARTLLKQAVSAESRQAGILQTRSWTSTESIESRCWLPEHTWRWRRKTSWQGDHLLAFTVCKK